MPVKAVEVNRDAFKLIVWRLHDNDKSTGDYEDRLGMWKVEHRYKIAIGAVGYITPAGLYYVSSKALNPSWKMPESDWVPKEQWGQIIPGGDQRNPLKGAFISLGGRPIDGIGFHGTAAVESLGTRASHGCIRMAESDVLNLYDRIEVGTLVFIN